MTIKILEAKRVARDFSDFNDDDLEVRLTYLSKSENVIKEIEKYNVCLVPGDGWHECTYMGEAISALPMYVQDQLNSIINKGLVT